MALSFLKDRDENAVLGNMGNFASPLSGGASVQTALEIYRKDQETHHEQSIASDLTRGLLRKVFRETVLESSRQVKRKYSYSAVGSSRGEDLRNENMGIMSQLKKLQKERLIVARLGFPDKAMEIDGHIEEIRADLRREREKEDSRVLEEELATLAVGHEHRLSSLERELEQDAKNKRDGFERERSVLRGKQEKQFAQLVDDAIKRAIGKSKSCSCTKRYLCRHNKTASFNTRRPKKEVIHFRKNAKRLRHGGRLDESAAWEEKAAELDAEHLDKWREEVAAGLTASAWGGSSSALDQLASQHQREILRMETRQANDWTLLLMRHQTMRRNCNNAIMVEQKKLRNACKKNAEERHRREMLGVQAAMEGEAQPNPHRPPTRPAPRGSNQENDRRAASVDNEDIAGMLQDVMDDGATREGKTPVRPSSAPSGRGRRPQPNQHTSPATGTGGGENKGALTGGGDEENTGGDQNSSCGDSRDLGGFDELERTDFSYDEYPSADSPEEPEWIHVPWCGTNSGDIVVLDEPPQSLTIHPAPTTAPPSFCSSSSNGGVTTTPREASADDGEVCAADSGNSRQTEISLAAEEAGRNCENGQQLPVALQDCAISGRDAEGDIDEGEYFDSIPPDRGAASRRPASADGLTRYDWDATKVPVRPALSANSQIPSGSRAEKIKARNERRKNPNKKVVSWGENLEVPPEEEDSNDDDEASGAFGGEGDQHYQTGTETFGLPSGMIDDIVDGIVEEEGDSDDATIDHPEPRRSLPFSGQREEMRLRTTTDECVAAGKDDCIAAGQEELRAEVVGELDGRHAESEDNNGKEEDGNALSARRRSSVDGEGAAGNGLVPNEQASSTRRRPMSKLDTRTMLQHALDAFCLIRLLHGDWMSLLNKIAEQDMCWGFLRRWSAARTWARDVDACSSARPGKTADGRVSWGAAAAAAATVAAPEILASFVGSPAGQEMISCETGRIILGGSTVEEEPALARSRRPWRTLFERSLGPLPHGAVLSLAEKTRHNEDVDGGPEVVASAGKVVWANEGFERLAGVDATDVVGQNLASLLDVGLEEGKELTLSLELGQGCVLWMTMAVGQGSDITDVLCLHQPVTVPPELSDEGNYSVLLLFDTVSDSLQVNDEEAQESDRNEERARNDDGDDNDVTNYNQERHRHSPEMPPNEYGGDDWARRHCCSALSTAMVHLLTASTVNTEGAAHFLHEENELNNGGGLRWREFEMGSVEKLAAGSTTIGQAEGAGRTRRRATQSLDGWPPPSVKLEDRTPTISTPAVVSTGRRWSGDMAAAEDVSRAMDVAVGYSSEDFSPGPRGDLVQSLEHITTDACGTEDVVDPIEKKSEELVGDGGLVCSEPREDVHIRQYAPGDNFAEQVDEIGGGRDPIDCDDDDDGGSGGDPYEDDFFSDVSSPSFDKVDTNGSITGKSTDGVMQDSTDTAAEQSRESKTLESGPMSPVTMVTAARDWQDGGGIQSPPLWRETDADDPCWSVSPGVRWPSGDGLSSEEGPGGGSVGKGGGGDNVPPPVSEQIERGSSWSDGIVEYDESWVASGARDNIRDSGTTKSRDGRDDGGGGANVTTQERVQSTGLGSGEIVDATARWRGSRA